MFKKLNLSIPTCWFFENQSPDDLLTKSFIAINILQYLTICEYFEKV